MIAGTTVTVKRREQIGVDGFNSPIYAETFEDVENVLIQPSVRNDFKDTNRQDGDRIRYQLHFPKTYDKNLRNTEINVRGSYYKVVGNPDHYMLENCPTDWWMPVEVESIEG